MDILQVAEWTVDFGGEEHTGWLPKGAAIPPRTPLSRVDIALAILRDPGGYILEWRGPTPETSGDTWHASVREAVEAAEQNFGVPADAWSTLP